MHIAVERRTLPRQPRGTEGTWRSPHGRTPRTLRQSGAPGSGKPPGASRLRQQARRPQALGGDPRELTDLRLKWETGQQKAHQAPGKGWPRAQPPGPLAVLGDPSGVPREEEEEPWGGGSGVRWPQQRAREALQRCKRHWPRSRLPATVRAPLRPVLLLLPQPAWSRPRDPHVAPLGLQPPPQPGSAPAPWLLACEFLCLLPSPGNAHTTFRSRLLLEARPDAPAELGGASVLGGVQPPLSPVVLCSPLTRAWQTPVPLDTDQASGEMHPAMVSPPHSLSHLVTRNRRALVSGRASEPRAPTVCQTHCPPGPHSTQHAQGPWEPHLPTGHRKGLPGGGQDPRPQAWGPGPLLAIQHPAHGEPSTHVCHMVRLPGPEGTAKSDF